MWKMNRKSDQRKPLPLIRNSLLIIALFFCLCNCTKEEDSVMVDFWCFAVYGYENVGDISLYLTKDKCLCSYKQDDSLMTVEISEPVAKAIWLLADSLFIEKTAHIYYSKKKTDCCQFHEGNQMIITVSKNGDKRCEKHYIGDIYSPANKPQLSEDYYEYIYSDTYRLFCQYIELIHAYVSGQDAWNYYTDDMRNMNKNSIVKVFPAILQVCDSLNKSKR